MKILLINNLGINYGGAETIVRQLKEGLIERGHDTRVLSGDEPNSPDHFSDYTFGSFRSDSYSRFLLFIINPFAIWSLYKILKKYKPDIVHLHTITKASPFILLLLRKIPTILTIHDHTLFDPTRPHDYPSFKIYEKVMSQYFIKDKKSLRFYGEKLRLFFSRYYYKNIDIVISCSNFYAEIARESKFFKKVITVKNGIQSIPFHAIKNKNALLYVGRIDDSKGLDTLLQAMPIIIQSNPKVTLDIVGDGPFKKTCELISKELKIENNINFLGYVNNSKIINYLVDTSVVIVPSICPDNFPTICLEAMFVGRPLVASRTGGIPEIITQKEFGSLFNRGDSNDLALQVIKLLQELDAFIHTGKSVHDYAEKNFSIKTNINRVLEIYTSLLLKHS